MLCDVAELYLETLALRDKLQALVLSDEAGFLIAGACSELDAHWLAALGCESATRAVRDERLDSLIVEVTQGAQLHAMALELGGETLYLTAVGGRVSRPMEVARTLERILFSGPPWMLVAPSELQ